VVQLVIVAQLSGNVLVVVVARLVIFFCEIPNCLCGLVGGCGECCCGFIHVFGDCFGAIGSCAGEFCHVFECLCQILSFLK